MENELKKKLPAKLIQISEAISQEGGTTYLVGGWVRDAILNKECKDFDLEIYGITDSQLDSVLKKFGKPSHVGKAFGITLLVIDGIQYDFAFPRTEQKIDEGHKGFEVQTDPFMTFSEAASRRDFTINAMGMKIPQFELEDPYNGKEDLSRLILRHVGPAFGEDPLRALRAVQFAARFKLSVVKETVQICKEQDLSELSVERIEEEFRKLFLKSDQPEIGLALLKEMDLLRFFEEWQSLDWNLVLERVRAANPYIQTLEDELREMQYYTLISLGLKPTKVSSFLDRVTRLKRYLKDIPLRVEALQNMLNLNEAILVQTQGQFRRLALRFKMNELIPLYSVVIKNAEQIKVLEAMAKKWGVFDEIPKPFLNGRDLIPLGIKPGPDLGLWIQKAFEKQLDGELLSLEDSIAWVKSELSSGQ